MKRLTDEKLNHIIELSHSLATPNTDECTRSMAYSNLALIEIQLRVLDKIKR